MMNYAPTDQPTSQVSSCDVTGCTFNVEKRCGASAIHVTFVDGMAHCATYEPGGARSEDEILETPGQGI